MKHLTKYRLFESNEYLDTFGKSVKRSTISELMYNLKDICLELEDMGFEIKIPEPYSQINKSKPKNLYIYLLPRRSFSINRVKEVVDRISDYLGDKLMCVWYRTSNLGSFDENWAELKGEEIHPSSWCYGVKIKFIDE